MTLSNFQIRHFRKMHLHYLFEQVLLNNFTIVIIFYCHPINIKECKAGLDPLFYSQISLPSKCIKAA